MGPDQRDDKSGGRDKAGKMSTFNARSDTAPHGLPMSDSASIARHGASWPLTWPARTGKSRSTSVPLELPHLCDINRIIYLRKF